MRSLSLVLIGCASALSWTTSSLTPERSSTPVRSLTPLTGYATKHRRSALAKVTMSYNDKKLDELLKRPPFFPFDIKSLTNSLGSIAEVNPPALLTAAKGTYGPIKRQYSQIFNEFKTLLKVLVQKKDKHSLECLKRAIQEQSEKKFDEFINLLNKKYLVNSEFLVSKNQLYNFITSLSSKDNREYSFLAMVIKDLDVLPLKPPYKRNYAKLLEAKVNQCIEALK